MQATFTVPCGNEWQLFIDQDYDTETGYGPQGSEYVVRGTDEDFITLRDFSELQLLGEHQEYNFMVQVPRVRRCSTSGRPLAHGWGAIAGFADVERTANTVTVFETPYHKRKRKRMDNLSELKSDDLNDTKFLIPDNRPDWDSWFMTLCFVVAQRSLDKDTKHGCVVVDDSKTILSVGYNSPPRGCSDAFVPLERPEKYDYMEHSEENAIVNAARSGINLRGSIFYITGPPCHHCFAKMLNVGASKIIHGPTSSAMVGSNTAKVIEFMKINQDIQVVELKDVSPVFQLLSKTESYINKKVGREE